MIIRCRKFVKESEAGLAAVVERRKAQLKQSGKPSESMQRLIGDLTALETDGKISEKQRTFIETMKKKAEDDFYNDVIGGDDPDDGEGAEGEVYLADDLKTLGNDRLAQNQFDGRYDDVEAYGHVYTPKKGKK